jgi:protein KRI1
VAFYPNIDDEDVDVAASSHRNTKPMYLTDYHRENLLKGDILENNEHESEPTYAQQQDELKNIIVKEIHAAAEQLSSGGPYSEDDGNTIGIEFLVTKKLPANGLKQKEQESVLAPVDIENADQDPETFLSKFMAAKAWVPVPGSRFQPFESDNEEEEQQAEAFEEAYNLRFENPQVSNEKLMSHARDTAARYSVRKEHVNSRKRARETGQSKKEMEKIEREQEKARLRKLKLEEVEEKIKKIKMAAGLNRKALDPLDWSAFLTEDWDDERWEAEMQKRFGETYYAKPELDGDLSGDELHKKKKVKKPKWDDDIDITDLVPDFHEEVSDVHFSVSGDSDIDRVEKPAEMQSKSGNKSFKRELEHQRREARRERRKIEQMVDEQINVQFALEGSGRKDPKVGLFRYRETSPVTYGLTTYDILMADDSQLNQYAGLKKLAPFRDPDKKRRDKKRLGKKARLRQWRKETFGSERGPTNSLQDLLAEQNSGRLPRGSSSVDKGTSDGKRQKGSKKSRKDVE